MYAHVYVTCVHAAAEGCTHTVTVSSVTGAPVELYGQFWHAQAQSDALEHSIIRQGQNMQHKVSAVDSVKLELNIWSSPLASGRLAEHWHAFCR